MPSLSSSRRIAMWSGPRNISTAMMRSWGNRPDTVVVDEPFYAHYLTQTEYEHPGRNEIIQAYETDWVKVTAMLTSEIPGGKQVFYQKHMTHHLLDHMDIEWIEEVSNCFLIRSPREVIISFSKVIPNPSIDQLGFPQQLRLFRYVRDTLGLNPPVIDAKDVLQNPRGVLSALCKVLELPFYEEMLTWQAGKRETDGIWAKYWYDAVEKSTEFAPYRPSQGQVPAHLIDTLEECEAIYEEMLPFRLTIPFNDKQELN